MKRKSLFLSAVILLFGGLVLAACSKDNSDDNGNGGTPPETPTVNTTADVVILSYGIGGGDLDSDAECDFIKAAYMLQSYKNVRYFAQYKYSSEDGFAKTTAKNKEKDPSYNYQLSGDYGKVYRFELTPSMINPQSIDQYFNFLIFSGQKTFLDLSPYKFGDENFKMYDPKNMADFIQWAMQQAPQAKTFILAIGDHGGAYEPTVDYDKSTASKAPATRGIMYDENIDGKPCMSPREIAQAFSLLTADQRSKIQLLYFDCCLMNNLEVLGEVKDCAPYVLGSCHSVTASNHGLLVQKMNSATKDNIATVANSYLTDLLAEKRQIYLKDRNEIFLKNIDYTLTDMSKIDGVYAALKDVVDFMVKQDVSATEGFTKAASSCYQFVDQDSFYDVMDYLQKLKAYAFPNNTEFATLVDKMAAAVKAAMIGHGDYSFSMDPTNGSSQNLTYSVTIGFNCKALNLEKTYTEEHAAIMNAIKAGGGTDAKNDPYFSQIILDNGDLYAYTWTDPNYKPTNKETFSSNGNVAWFNWDATYKALYFDKQTGWSKWMLKNPGVPLNNPPYNDEGDVVREVNYGDGSY
jgi:hypothetical protein